MLLWQGRVTVASNFVLHVKIQYYVNFVRRRWCKLPVLWSALGEGYTWGRISVDSNVIIKEPDLNIERVFSSCRSGRGGICSYIWPADR